AADDQPVRDPATRGAGPLVLLGLAPLDPRGAGPASGRALEQLDPADSHPRRPRVAEAREQARDDQAQVQRSNNRRRDEPHGLHEHIVSSDTGGSISASTATWSVLSPDKHIRNYTKVGVLRKFSGAR